MSVRPVERPARHTAYWRRFETRGAARSRAVLPKLNFDNWRRMSVRFAVAFGVIVAFALRLMVTFAWIALRHGFAGLASCAF